MIFSTENVVFNTDNLGYIIEKNDKFIYQYRRKVSIQDIEIPLHLKEDEKHKFFHRFGFFKLDKFWINPKNIALIHEDYLDRKNNETAAKVHLFINFINGLSVDVLIEAERWKSWKDTRLR